MELESFVRSHRCSSHPIFEHWAQVDPEPDVLGALFHQVQMFCASTRPGRAMPDALDRLEMRRQSELLREIVASEEDHGPELATMAGFIINRRAGTDRFGNLGDQVGIEAGLKRDSDVILGRLPGYDESSGLTVQAQRAIGVMERRASMDAETTVRNLGTTLALEVISNRHLIPGEKHCLVDTGLYGTNLDAIEMHYLLEHWGECGAEEQHERNALEAIEAVCDDSLAPLVREGARDFLDALADLWDVLDAALLQSGRVSLKSESVSD